MSVTIPMKNITVEGKKKTKGVTSNPRFRIQD